MIKLNPIQIVGAVLLVLLLVLGGCKIKSYGDARFAAGEAKVQKDWDEAVERGKAEIARLQTEAGKVEVRTVVEYRDRIQTIRLKGEEIVREVQVFVPVGSGELAGGFRLFHDAAAGNKPLPDPAAIADAAPVDAQTVASTVASNYQAHHEDAARLIELQDYVFELCKTNPPPAGCGPPPH